MEDRTNPPPAGPGVLGVLAGGVAAGAYTSIVGIVAPAQASPGSTVNVEIKVQNIYSSAFYIGVVAQYDSTIIINDWAAVDPGAIHSFYGSFTMPNTAVTISVWSLFWDGTNWIQDDYKQANIALSAAYAGSIVDKWVNKSPEGNYLSIPASVKADGNTFEVGVSYRNDSSVNITGGVEVRVSKPDGSVVAPAIDWSGIGIGQTLNKQYNIAAVNQVGNWAIEIRFLTQSMQVLDTFSGTCLIAQAVLTPEFSGFGITDYSKS